MTNRLAWADARTAAFAAASALPVETVSVLDCVGRTLTRDLTALQDVPHFASSAMDGWAVAGAGPWSIGTDAGALRPGHAHPIVTGGLIRPGVDAVLRSEHADEHSGLLTVRAGFDVPAAGRDVRRSGTESRAGDVVIASGARMNPAHAAVAAGCGHDTVTVAARARVALVTTGAEVVAAGVPKPGFVRDSFGPMLPGAIESFAGGAGVVSHLRLTDDRQHLLDAIGTADADVVVTTGGTAHSPVDHVRSVLAELGATLIVESIDVRPGSPSLLARLPSGVFVVALPGNPLAAMMGALLLLEPLLAGLAGHPLPGTGEVVVGESHEPGKVRLAPFELVDGAAMASGWRGSGMLRGLADAHGVLVVPAEGLVAGARAATLALPWPTG